MKEIGGDCVPRKIEQRGKMISVCLPQRSFAIIIVYAAKKFIVDQSFFTITSNGGSTLDIGSVTRT
jgi:hypothetical protein